MSILPVLLIISLILAAGFLTAFLIATRSGQFDDTLSPSLRILDDEDSPLPKNPRSNKEE